MSREALGLIETVGLAAAIEAADTCMKSANVKLIGYELTKGDGMVTIKIKGDVSAVKAAIDSAKMSAAAVNTVYASLVIPRPADKLDLMIESKYVVGLKSKPNEEKTIIEDVPVILEDLVIEEKPVIKEEIVVNDEPVIIVEPIIVDGAVQEFDYEDIKKQMPEEVCNLCYDPKCTRKKGMTRKLCIHYKNSEGENK